MKPAPKGQTIRFENINFAAFRAESCVFECCILTLQASDPAPSIPRCEISACVLQGDGWPKHFAVDMSRIRQPKDLMRAARGKQ